MWVTEMAGGLGGTKFEERHVLWAKQSPVSSALGTCGRPQLTQQRLARLARDRTSRLSQSSSVTVSSLHRSKHTARLPTERFLSYSPCFLWDRVSLYGPWWPETYYVDQPGLNPQGIICLWLRDAEIRVWGTTPHMVLWRLIILLWHQKIILSEYINYS